MNFKKDLDKTTDICYKYISMGNGLGISSQTGEFTIPKG